METLFIKAKWDRAIKLSEEALDYFKNKKTVALFASVQFLNLNIVIKQLQDKGLEVKTTKSRNTEAEIQTLGCNIYSDFFNQKIIQSSDAILYIGDGLFHPQALLLSQVYSGIKEILVWNPVDEKMKILKEIDIEDKIKKLKANLKNFVAAKTIGIFVSTKPGQQYLKSALELKDKLKDKTSFIFLDNNLDINQLENFPFIDCWVNSACPRIIEDSKKPMINIREALEPLKYLDRLKW